MVSSSAVCGLQLTLLCVFEVSVKKIEIKFSTTSKIIDYSFSVPVRDRNVQPIVYLPIF